MYFPSGGPQPGHIRFRGLPLPDVGPEPERDSDRQVRPEDVPERNGEGGCEERHDLPPTTSTRR